MNDWCLNLDKNNYSVCLDLYVEYFCQHILTWRMKQILKLYLPVLIDLRGVVQKYFSVYRQVNATMS